MDRLEFWPWFWERGGLGVDIPGRLLRNVHKMSRMKKKITGSGTLARGYRRDLGEDSRCRQEGARESGTPSGPGHRRGLQMVRRWSRRRDAHVRTTMWSHTISKENRE